MIFEEKHIEDCVLQYFNEIFTTTNKYSNATRVQVTVGIGPENIKKAIMKTQINIFHNIKIKNFLLDSQQKNYK